MPLAVTATPILKSSIEEALSRREVRRYHSRTEETIVYDTGQWITRKLATIHSPHYLQSVTGQSSDPVVSTETVDPRCGVVRFEGPASALDRALAINAAGFAELDPWLRAMLGYRDEAAGTHGMLRLLDRSLITTDYKGFVAYIQGGPGPITGASSLHSGHTIDVLIFKPGYWADGSRCAEPSPGFPNRHNSWFLITLKIDAGRWHTQMSAISYSGTCKVAGSGPAIDPMAVTSNYGRYYRINDELLRTLEALAPLPIEYSDCGRNLGFPLLNETYRNRRVRACRRRCGPNAGFTDRARGKEAAVDIGWVRYEMRNGRAYRLD